MGIKTTLTFDKEIYKAAKRIAVERETTVSRMMQKALLLMVSDPEGLDDSVELLQDEDAMKAIQEAEEARKHHRKGYYIDWEKIRDL